MPKEIMRRGYELLVYDIGELERCPKCSYSAYRAEYKWIEAYDLLKFTCGVCGFSWYQFPDDHYTKEQERDFEQEAIEEIEETLK